VDGHSNAPSVDIFEVIIIIMLALDAKVVFTCNTTSESNYYSTVLNGYLFKSLIPNYVEKVDIFEVIIIIMLALDAKVVFTCNTTSKCTYYSTVLNGYLFKSLIPNSVEKLIFDSTTQNE
jgi:predicted small secreted protein